MWRGLRRSPWTTNKVSRVSPGGGGGGVDLALDLLGCLFTYRVLGELSSWDLDCNACSSFDGGDLGTIVQLRSSKGGSLE